MKGKVKFFDRTKGFGFITAEDGIDYYVSQDALAEGTVLNDGDEVTFSTEEGPRGKKAVGVKKE
jgi:CspA family cold shock protein